ncbi:MAG: hypothetical protein DCF23_05750 [Cyanobium sp.]|nr:hypothetical protein [Synechococcus sp. CS-1326]PZV04573.1 MAG: hypothetical protein DCF23_05750 [Cyanobium sp.]
MPARRSSPKLPKAAASSPDLAALGFRIASSGPHTSKTLMLQELVALFEAVPADAPTKAYRIAIVEENVLGKRTATTRKETASRLKALHGLDPSKPMFRVMRRLWDIDSQARPLLALLTGLARDPLLRSSAPLVMGMAPGTVLSRSDLIEAIRAFTLERLSPRVLTAVAQNTASSWTQTGHLQGKVRKVRQSVTPSPTVVAYSLWLGYSEGRRGKGLLNTLWTSVLDCSPSALIELALQAKRLGLLEASHGGGVLAIDPTGLDPLQERARS